MLGIFILELVIHELNPCPNSDIFNKTGVQRAYLDINLFKFCLYLRDNRTILQKISLFVNPTTLNKCQIQCIVLLTQTMSQNMQTTKSEQ